MLLELDDDEQETGRIAGVEMLGFLEFDEWKIVPRLPFLWQLPGWEPLPLDELLQRMQHKLRQQAVATKD